MSTTELFKKHFGEESASVDLKHPNVEAFFEELNQECLEEDKIKIGDTVKIIHSGELIRVLNIVYFGSETHNPYPETRIIYDKGSIDIECCVLFSHEV